MSSKYEDRYDLVYQFRVLNLTGSAIEGEMIHGGLKKHVWEGEKDQFTPDLYVPFKLRPCELSYIREFRPVGNDAWQCTMMPIYAPYIAYYMPVYPGNVYTLIVITDMRFYIIPSNSAPSKWKP